MNNLQHNQLQFSNIKSLIETGDIKIPQFQRNYVWKVKQAAGLIDSILKNYPIGNFIFWRTDRELTSIRNIGGLEFQTKRGGERVDYVLDGQQRITSLYASLTGTKIQDKQDFSQIWIDLDATYEDQIVTTNSKTQNKISLLDLISHKWKNIDESYEEKLLTYYNSLIGFQFPITTIVQSSTNVATEVFTRLNTGGKKLGIFEIMSAATYDEDLNFDLQEKFKQLNEELKSSNYSITDSQLLQFISILLTNNQGCSSKFILNLDKHKFIQVWDEAVRNIKSAVDHIRQNLCPTDKLLPFPGTLVLFAYFFNKSKTMTQTQKIYLDDMFWRISLGGRYSSGLETKLQQDIKKVDSILNGELPKYEWHTETSPNHILTNGSFEKGSAFSKAWICLLTQLGPKSFRNNTLITVDGNWQLTKNSPNLHHFFPKNYLKESKNLDSADHILNMTIIDDSLNKHISDKVPSVYINKLQEDNTDLTTTLLTHLVGDTTEFGITTNDYNKFKSERAKLFSEAINNRIIFQQTGYEYQDVEEDVMEIVEDY